MSSPMFSPITGIDKNFDNIFRINCQNGIILDIYSPNEGPSIGQIFKFSFNTNTSLTNTSSTTNTMNGIIFGYNNSTEIYISFGGLLGKFPNHSTSYNIGDKITLHYTIDTCIL